jgi:hypothetical protein
LANAVTAAMREVAILIASQHRQTNTLRPTMTMGPSWLT